MGLGWPGDDVVLVTAFVGLVGGMVQESMVVVVDSALTTIFSGSVFGPSLRACMMVAVGSALTTTIVGGSVFGPSLRACMVLAVGPRLITIFGGHVFGPMGGWNFGLRWNARLRSFSFIKLTLGRAVAAS